MTAILVKAIADLRRRRLQAGVIFVTAFLAVGTGTMALTLLSQTHDPYQTAFDAQKGAHLQVAYDSRTDPAAMAGTSESTRSAGTTRAAVWSSSASPQAAGRARMTRSRSRDRFPS